jgi:hypothetical protein
LGQLIGTPSHAWPRVRPKLYLLLAYKRRGRGIIQKRKNIARKLCPIAESVLSQPFSLSSSFRIIQAKQLEDKEEEEPKIRIKEQWLISIIIVS